MSSRPSIVALIPARSGSKRVPHKNIRFLGDHPLLAYTIAAAKTSGIFDAIIVSTESDEYAEIARHYGAEVPWLRPKEFAGDRSPDIDWVEHTLNSLGEKNRKYDCFSILRPTSPFRLPATIVRAWDQFLKSPHADSIRAVEKCREHPGKMWIVRGAIMYPLVTLAPGEQPWHSSQYAALPEVYVQNASLEIAWSRVVFEGRSIAGTIVVPFLSQDVEGVDVNNDYDWEYAKHLLRAGRAKLPIVEQSPYRK